MSKMIKCSICNEDIAANAKVCPKCGAKNKKPIYKKWWIWVIAVVVISAICSGGNENESVKKDTDRVANTEASDSNNKDTIETEKDTTHKIGDTVETKKFAINIINAETTKMVGSQYAKAEPADGGIYVVVSWECKNISDSPVSAFSLPQIRLSDKNGTKYDPDLNATTYYTMEAQLDTKALSDLNPGIKVKDAEVFEISEEIYNEGGFSILVNADEDFEININ